MPVDKWVFTLWMWSHDFSWKGASDQILGAKNEKKNYFYNTRIPKK